MVTNSQEEPLLLCYVLRNLSHLVLVPVCPQKSPSWVDPRPNLTAVGGVVRLTPDPDCVGQRPSRSETGFAIFLSALAYFWSVG